MRPWTPCCGRTSQVRVERGARAGGWGAHLGDLSGGLDAALSTSPLSLSIPGSTASPCLTLADAKALVAAASGSDAPSPLVVQSVFDAPRVEYDPIRRRFNVLSTSSSSSSGGAARAPLLGSAPDRAALHAQRFLWVAQRVERSPLFARPALAGVTAGGEGRGAGGGGGGGARGGACELADVRTLLASPPGSVRVVLGCLAQLEDGRFYLEDPTGNVPLLLSGAVAAAGGCFVEGGAALVEGVLTRSRAFEARALGQPPLEGRAASLAGPWQGLPTLVSPALAEAARAGSLPPPPRLVLLADCRLDDPATLPRLGAVFGGYEGQAAAAASVAAAVGVPPPPPPAFVLMGDFWGGGGSGWWGGGAGGGAGRSAPGRGTTAAAPPSAAGGGADAAAQRAAFAALGALAARHPTLAAGSTFIFIPGPADAAAAGCSLLPGPPLPPSLAAPLTAALGAARCAFPSNPARLRVGAKEVVIFRSDMAARLRAAALLPPTDGVEGVAAAAATPADAAAAAAEADASAFEHAALTLLSQAHLSPLPLDASPVAWAHDGGLRLYPLPDALVLAGGAGPGGRSGGCPLAVEVEGVQCVDPGSLRAGGGGAFAAYAAGGEGEVEVCSLPEDE